MPNCAHAVSILMPAVARARMHAACPRTWMCMRGMHACSSSSSNASVVLVGFGAPNIDVHVLEEVPVANDVVCDAR